MKHFFFFVALLSAFNLSAQDFTTAEEVINKHLEVTKIKDNASKITDMVMSLTSETPRGVSETEIKIAFPFKAKMAVYGNGMTFLTMVYDGEKFDRKSPMGGNMGGGQFPKTGEEAKMAAITMNPFQELEYKNMGFVLTLLPSEGDFYVVEIKDGKSRTFKNYYNKKTGFKEKVWSTNESPRGKMESTLVLNDYKSFKGSEILFPSSQKQTMQFGEVSSDLQSIKFNKGLKSSDFVIE
ncbi:MAG: hypothetical protein ACRCVT_00175 [Leadbetterella sp.]